MSQLIGDLFLLASTLLFVCAYTAYNINRKLPLNRTLTIMCLFMGIGSLMDAFQFYSKTAEMCMFFSKLSRLGWCFYAPAAFHFGLYLSNVIEKIKNRYIIYLAYLPAFYFLYINFSYHLRISGFAASPASDLFNPIYSFGFLDNAFSFYQYSLVILTLIFVFIAQFSGKSRRLRKQAIIIITTSVIALTLDILHYTLSPEGKLSWLWGLELIIYSTGLYISILFLRFTVPAPSLVSDYILDQINEMIIVINTDGYILESNIAMNKMLKLPSDKIIGNHLDNYFPSLYNKIKDLTELHNVEMDLSTSDKNIVPIKMSATLIIDKHGDYIGDILVCSDLRYTKMLQDEIAERKRIENELIIADRAKDDFLSLISHELLSPLSAIFLWVELAKNDHTLQTKAIDIIEENARRQFSLVDELLLFTRLQHEKIFLNEIPTDINQIITSVINQIEETGDQNRHTIVFNKPSEQMLADIDVEKFTHIIHSLVSNAIEFSNNNSTIIITVGKKDNYCEISFTDNRDVNDSANLNDLFDPYHIGVEKSGINIGELHLAVARSLAELHGGHLIANFNHANDGLTFTLRISCSNSTSAPL